MNPIQIIKREMSDDEFQSMNDGFDKHTLENSVIVQHADRFGYVAIENDTFIGCSSGLAYRDGSIYSGWFYLTDLFVDKAYRAKGLGASLLIALEEEIKALGVHDIWTWTAGFEAPGFYLKQGWSVFTEFENWYSDGSSRIGLRKKLIY